MSFNPTSIQFVSKRCAIAPSFSPQQPSDPVPPLMAAYHEVGMTDRQFSPPTSPTATPTPIPTIVFLHGFLGDRHNWSSVIAHLQSSGIHCVALDLLGFGESSKPRQVYDIATEVAFVHGFLQHLEFQHPARSPLYLVGHSFGGWVAAAYALAHPDCVQGLGLIAPAGIRDDEFCGRYTHLRPLLWQTPMVDWALTVARPLSRLMGQASVVNTLAWFRRELMAQPAARSFLLDRLRPEDAIDTVEKEIHQLRLPTWVIAGEQDATIPLWHCQTYADRIPNAQLVVLENADHGLLTTHAAAIARYVCQLVANSLPNLASIHLIN